MHHYRHQPCKNLIQSTTHQPLQIRTYKHRCFVFCMGHKSLTCVPGIGNKNKYLLNQSGIEDLSGLYSKYRSFNNKQEFNDWLQNDIGFTSYQAKMTTCGIGSKLGEIKEINTGLIPICCPTRERRREKDKLFFNDKNIKKPNRHSQSKDDIRNKENVRKKRKMKKIKLENLSPSSNKDSRKSEKENLKQINTSNEEQSDAKDEIDNDAFPSTHNDRKFNSDDEKLLNKLSDNYLTGVKPPNSPLFAVRRSPMKKEDESNLLSDPIKLSIDQKNETNEIIKTKPMKLNSSSMINEPKQNNPNTLELKNGSPSTTKDSKTDHNLDRVLSSTGSSNISRKINSKIFNSKNVPEQQKANEIPMKKSSIDPNSLESSKMTMQNRLQTKGSQTNTNDISQHYRPSQDSGINRPPISSSKLSTDDINLDKNKKNSTDSLSKFQEVTTKDKYQSPSLNTSTKDTAQEPLSEKKENRSQMELENLIANKFPMNKRTSNDKINELNQTKDEKHDEAFVSTKQTSQPTLDSSQDTKNELLPALKRSPNSSVVHEHLKKPILRDTQSKSISPTPTDLLLATIKRQQQLSKDKSLKPTSSPVIVQMNTSGHNNIDPDIKSKSDERSSDISGNKSISAIKHAYASLPVSTPAIFPMKPKSTRKSDALNLINLSTSNNPMLTNDHQTRPDPELNHNNIVSPLSDSSRELTTKKEDVPQFDDPSSRSINEINPEKITSTKLSDLLVPNLNEANQQSFQEEMNKEDNRIGQQNAHNTHEDILSSKTNSTNSVISQMPILETKKHNDIVQPDTSITRQDDDHRNTPDKSIVSIEPFVQAKEKHVVTSIESNNKNDQLRQFSEEETPIQKKLYPFSVDHLKASSNKTPSNQINQLEDNKTSMPSKSAQTQQESNNIFDPMHKEMNQSVLPSIDTERASDEISSSPIINSLVDEKLKTTSTGAHPSILEIGSISSWASPENLQNSHENKDLDPLLDHRMSENTGSASKDASNDGYSDKNKLSIKPSSSATRKQTDHDQIQQKRSDQPSNLSTLTNISPTINVSEQDRLPDLIASTLSNSQQNESLTNSIRTEVQQPVSLTNKLSQFSKIKRLNERESLSTLSSLSDSDQSIDSINSSIEKIDSNPIRIKDLEKEIESETKNDVKKSYNKIKPSNSAVKLKDSLENNLTRDNRSQSDHSSISSDLYQRSNLITESSINKIPYSSVSSTKSSLNIVQFPKDPSKQSSFTSNTLINHPNNDKFNASVMPYNRLNQSPLPKNIEDNQFINKNLSEIIHSKEKFELKNQIFGNDESKTNIDSTDCEQLWSSPSCPKLCNALWNSIANEPLLLRRRKYHLIRIKKYPSDQKI